MPVFGFVGLDEMVGPVALMCDQRLDQRVMKDIDVTGSHPHLTRQDDRRIDSDNVVAASHHRSPPLALDVLFELNP
ncbi:Uncharacterised protein [Mycobacterium tuberculosis]|nr:Uncharacterised protein [Mycobacterium tuberculosis]CKR53825.1 Uncharacterised protein [Mycobacterium tuberculosis]CKU51462.1 Uncharacterised protein [Mycobacterium tuberculosis]CNU43570.1 Uncharacterised protein [Mycobacterium tuberculosis]COW32152.1 Uncharacterised protein [Mycobacterium tuberculosis]